jgi:hypothetical protein
VDAGQPNNTFVSNGYNLIGNGNATGAFNQTGDQVGVTDPKLDPLADNGGPTQTHALLSGSPAINAILGLPRFQGRFAFKPRRLLSV